MKDEITNWCKNCTLCATWKNTGRKKEEPLKPITPQTKPMELCAMDVLGPLPETISGNKYIIVFSDYFTRWTEAFAMRDQKAETIFVEEIMFQYGTLKKLLTDWGAAFFSDIINRVTELFKIHKLNTSPYHPQTAGLVETFNQTLWSMVSNFTSKKQNNWDIYIKLCLFAYNASKNETTGYSSFYLMYLRETYLPIDLNLLPETS